MANKTTVPLTREQYDLIIDTIKSGFTYGDGKVFKPNNRVAMALTLEATLGMRIGDILNLKLNDIIKFGDKYKLDIIESKTKKERRFTVSTEIYNYIKLYCFDNEIKPSAKIFQIGERAVQKQLKIVCDYLGLENISTHSFRKFYATEIYNENNYNIELVRKVLQHSNARITQRYIGVDDNDLELAVTNINSNHNKLR